MLTSSKRLFQTGCPAAIQTTRSLVWHACVAYCTKELRVILHLLAAHLTWGRLCAAGKRLHLSLQRGTAARWCLLALPPGPCPDKLAQWLPACPPSSTCSGASIPALLSSWANMHRNGAELLPGFQEQNWAPINLLLISIYSQPSTQEQPGGINSVTPVMLSDTIRPGQPGGNRLSTQHSVG